MQISGGSGAGAGALYSALVAGKIQQSVKQQGRDVLQLLDASSVSASSGQSPPGVGEHLNIKA
jgi:hypothetical protein